MAKKESKVLSLIEHKGQYFIARRSVALILTALMGVHSRRLNYQELHVVTDIDLRTLYVYTQRLENSGLIKRKTIYDPVACRYQKIVSLNKKVQILPMQLITC